MLKPFQMQAQNLASLLSLVISGEPGISSWAGGHWKDSEILAGQKPLLSNAWSDISLIAKHRSSTSLYMGTTGESLKGGGMEGAATERSTKSSRVFTFFLSRARARAPSTQHMLGANSIPQMNSLEEYTLWNPFSFSQYNFQQNSNASSLICNHPSQQPNGNYTGIFSTPKQQENELIMLTRGLALAHNNAIDILAINQPNPIHKSLPRFDQLLPLDKATHVISHKPYHTGLVPLPSTLWPHCLAQDRLQLRLWHPVSSQSSNIGEIEVSEQTLKGY